MRAMAKQHAVSRGQHKHVGRTLFPGKMPRALQELAILHTAKLSEGAVGRLVTPDALGGREHRIAAIAFLVVAIVLIAVDDDLVTDLPALHLGADGIDDAGRI